MRFVHISDSHLGASGYSRRLSASGYNQREEDVCNSFQAAVDQIIELKPDFVLHSGDLFHTVRPTNRIINFAIRQILRVVNLEIPMVIISGNHDTPKQRTVGSVFSFFEVLSPLLHLVHRNQYELIKLKHVAIHAIPHCLNQEDFSQELAKVEIVGRPPTADGEYHSSVNILMLHGVVAGIREFSMGELAEQEIPSSYLQRGFDYVALGHYHRFCQVESGGYYAGSTERLSMSELGQEKGFVEVDLQTKNVKFHRVPTRDMIELPPLNARELDQEQVLLEIEKRVGAQDVEEKIVRLKVTSIPEHVYNSLDFRKIAELKSRAFHFDLKFDRKEEEARDQSTRTSIGKLNMEFQQFLKQAPVENLKKDRLLELGLRYLSAEGGSQ
ncbi:MAG: exonuclease SbcCD subunit D [Candidatus Zixiibacteriota bacterium]